MADLYLCGKDTGLVPLYDEQGTHIDCVKPEDLQAKSASKSSSLTVSTPPASASAQAPTAIPQRKLRVFKMPVVQAPKGKNYFAMAAKLPDLSAPKAQAPAEPQVPAKQAESPMATRSASPSSESESSKPSASPAKPSLYLILGLGVLGLGGLAYFMMGSRTAKPNRRKRRKR